MKNNSILVTGSLAFDFIMDFPGNFSDNINPAKLHIINLSFLVETLKKERGGTAGNIAYNLALLKMPVSILGSVGNDFEQYGEFLKTSGVDTSPVKIIPHEVTSSAFITTDKSDNQISAFYPGAMKMVENLKISSLDKKPIFTVISPTTPNAMTNFVRECKKSNIPYMFDPGMVLPRISDDQLKAGIFGAKILIGNDYEMGLICSRLGSDVQELLKDVEILITTLGAKGSLIQTSTQTIKIKAAKPKKVLDPTGAGDAYRAGFLAGFFRGFNLKICGKMGSVASCYAVEKYGTTNHGYSISDFCRRYEQNFHDKLEI